MACSDDGNNLEIGRVGRSTPPPVRGGGNRSGQGRGRRGASSTTPSLGKKDGRTEGRRSARGGGRDTSSRGSNDSLPGTTAKPAAVDQTSQGNISESNLLSDQDVLIAFGPYVRSGQTEAKRIHQEYLTNTLQQDFIRNARQFLIDIERSTPKTSEVDATIMASSSSLLRPPPGIHAPPQSVLVASPPGLGYEPAAGVDYIKPKQSVVPDDSSSFRPGPPPGMPPSMRPPPMAAELMSPPPKPKHSYPSSILPARSPTQHHTSILPARTPSQLASASEVRPVKPRRTQTRCNEQPGRLLANDIPAAAFNDNKETVITARPRSALTAKWILPLKYLRNRALQQYENQKAINGAPPQNLTVRDALKDLTVGLFRRGADFGSMTAIVSKEILASKDGSNGKHPSDDYFFNVDQQSDSIFGTVPFYAPRTPGTVNFRLYFEDEPHVTLATGPCIRVVPADDDIDSVLRFILSNFKTKISNGVSSMNALATVLELFSPVENERFFDGASRIAWGCLCESQKALEDARQTYQKKRQALEEKLEENLKTEKIQADIASLDIASLGVNDDEVVNNVETTSTIIDEERTKLASNEVKSKLLSEVYMNERKWREIQIVYSRVLVAAVTNDSIHLLLKRDVWSKLKLEYDLWCPFTESFALNPRSNSNHNSDCHESRHKMQQELLGFVPQSRLILSSAKDYRWKAKKRNLFKELSSAMKEIYNVEYAVSEEVWERREKIRASIEHIVCSSSEFPVGTKVAVFGSSANGFGSPSSDIDLCLQVPLSDDFTKANGVEAMTNLATKLSDAGLLEVDTVRLTARIPIVKFNFPYKDNDEEILVECDLSLQNPLACLNTSLLHTYSKISQTTCILASIIKRWAKARDINNPSKHTLSSYGYVIMLIHFLTSCDFNKSGFVMEKAGDPSPILPNLQLVDPLWAQNPSSGPYREITTKPKNKDTMVLHPTEPNYFVNAYFYRVGLENMKQFCSENHNDTTALGALLASFFHYYAYDFDYKKHVVSLNTKHSSPLMERESKAEEDGWSLFKLGLAIEDPFERFYDVAHVIKTSNFAHIHREFALAYTKIVNAAYSDDELPTAREIIDSICEPVSHDQNISNV